MEICLKLPLISLWEEIERGIRAYNNAKEIPLEMVILGVAKLRKNAPLLDNFRFLSLDSSQITPDRIGCIVNDSRWNIYLNDMYMMGAIHAGHEFHLSVTLTKNNLWDSRSNRPRVLGRELIMLRHAGYKLAFDIKSEKDLETKIGRVYHAPQNMNVEALTYNSFKIAIENISSCDALTKFLD